MKKRRNIFLKIFLLIVLFFFQGNIAHSNLNVQRHLIEISQDHDNNQSMLTQDNDSSDEDMIDESNIVGFSEQPECQDFGLRTQPLLNILFVSVWQPPKIF